MKFDASKIIWSADVQKGELIDVITSRVLPKGMWIKLDRLFF